MMRVLLIILCSLWAVCSVSAQDSRQEGTEGQAALPPAAFRAGGLLHEILLGLALGKAAPVCGLWAQVPAG